MDQYFAHLEWIDKEKQSLISTLEQWVNIHSGSDNLLGLSEMLEKLKEAFSSLDGSMDEISLPKRKILSRDGNFTEVELGKVLSIVRHPNAPIQILLSGHMDIAYPANLPLEKCRRSSPDILVGRGTADMKSGLLIMLIALKSLEMSPFSGNIGWKVLINPDEEIGSPGSKNILQKEAKHHHIGLIFEPSLPDGSLVSERKGSANFTIAIKGKAAHAGREFHMGHNAVTSAARFALAAESLTDLEEEVTVNIGYLKGGDSLNIVPDHALCGINIRVKTSDSMKIMKDKMNKIAEIENHREGIHLIIHQDTERLPKKFDKKTRSLFQSLKKCGNTLGMNIQWKSSGGVCDGNILAAAGLTTIDTLGGVGGNLHTAKEYVSISSIFIRAKLVARYLMQIAAGEAIIK